MQLFKTGQSCELDGTAPAWKQVHMVQQTGGNCHEWSISLMDSSSNKIRITVDYLKEKLWCLSSNQK